MKRTARWALGVMALLLCLAAAPTARADDGLEFAKRITGYIQASDGVALRYSALLPEASGRFPVIVDYSGYASGSIGSSFPSGRDVHRINNRLLEAGYAVLGVNMRGTACSEGGPFEVFDPRWGTDGRTVVEWAADQPWSNGRIGMAGHSFKGLSQLWTASTRPPHLRAIAPGMVVVDPYRDLGFPGGVENVLFPTVWWELDIGFWWNWAQGAAVSEGDARCAATVARNLKQAAPTSPPAVLKQHPYLDSWHREHTLVGRTQEIDVPVLSMEAYQDEATGTRGAYYQETLDPASTWYVGTNGRHKMYATNQRFVERWLIPFLDHFVRGEANGFEDRPRVGIWEDTVAEADDPFAQDAQPSRILRFDRFPPPTTPLAFQLRAGGRLTPAQHPDARGALGRRASVHATSYRYPVKGPSVNNARLGGGWDEQDPLWRQGSVAFTTAKLPDPITVWGSASADLWVSTTARDTDLQVTVTDVRPDGQEQYLQRGWVRLSDRVLDEEASTPTRPVHRDTESARREAQPGTPVLARVEIQKFEHTFRRGHRIRIWIDAPSTTGFYGFQSIMTPATNTIWHDGVHPSRLVLGQLTTAPASTAPACERVVFEPCRPDPLGSEEPANTSQPPAPSPPGPAVSAPSPSGPSSPPKEAKPDKGRLKVKVRPRREKAKSGRRARFKVTVKNRGERTARRTKVCMKVPKPALRPKGGECERLGRVEGGKREKAKFRVRATGHAKSGASYKLTFKAKAKGAKNDKAKAKLRVRG